MDNSLIAYPKLVDALSKTLDTTRGSELHLGSASYLYGYTGSLTRCARHTNEWVQTPFWKETVGDAIERQNRETAKRIYRREVRKLARKHWVGDSTFRIKGLSASINILN